MSKVIPRPLPIVPGSTIGPDGQPLSPFARFAKRIMDGGTVRDEDVRIVDEPRAPS